MFQMPSMTRKQFWRRQSKSVKRAEHDFLYREGVDDGYGGPIRTTVSEPSIGTTLLHVTGLGHVWATTGNLYEANTKVKSHSIPGTGMSTACHVKIKRRVNFLPTVRVVLIPSRMEYKEAEMAPLLWWEDTDYSAFKKSAIRELKALMEIQHLTSTKQALQILYQPGFHLELDFETLLLPSTVTVSTAPGNKALQSTPISQEEGGGNDSNRCGSPPAPCLEDDIEPDRRSSVLPKSTSAPDLMHAHIKIVTPPPPTKCASFSSMDTHSTSTNSITSIETTTTEPASFGILQARTDVDLTNHVHPGIWSSNSPHKTPSTTISTTESPSPPPLHPLAFLAE